MTIECSRCLINSEIGKIVEYNGENLCEECYELEINSISIDDIKFEWETYVSDLKEKNKNKEYDVLFAFSGGKDSTAALYYTIEKYNLRPLVFTVDHGFKNDTILDNCRNIIKYYNLDWFVLQLDKSTVKKIKDYAKNGDLPCYYCSKLWKNKYFSKVAQITSITDMFTGGDTLDQKSAIISRPEYGVKSVGLPLALNITTEKSVYDIAYSLGWKDPQTKGWDTDCTAVGVGLYNYRKKQGCYHIEELRHLSHRVRYGILEKEAAREMLNTEMVIDDKILNLFVNLH